MEPDKLSGECQETDGSETHETVVICETGPLRVRDGEPRFFACRLYAILSDIGN